MPPKKRFLINMIISKAEKSDLKEILALQKTAYLSEGKLLNNYNIQPLTQTFEETEEEFSRGIFLKAVDEKNSKIIGSVRGFPEGKTLRIGKLMVHPDFQSRGIGKTLLNAIEKNFPDMRYELFTALKNSKNISLYTKSGYKPYKTEKTPDGTEMVFLEKK
jgi:GNAT superfamily N-acetyltransferase